jgi:hypothetical protein
MGTTEVVRTRGGIIGAAKAADDGSSPQLVNSPYSSRKLWT